MVIVKIIQIQKEPRNDPGFFFRKNGTRFYVYSFFRSSNIVFFNSSISCVI